ncbi:Xaa-Pro dipeptidyl-peptidase [Herbihabitans rhizosphaerae]|nr:Xaa-Pro dipeptidyl-peptidase [Herbihabitans rhizosphaerae]
MRTSLRRRGPLVVLAAIALSLGLLAIPTTASAAPTQETAARPSQPVHAYADAVNETVWVDTGQPNPGGGTVRVAADIVRPKTDAATKVPVIMDASPYYHCCGRGNESQKKNYDQQGRPVGFPLFYDNYFVPRGYAVVLVDLSGSARSTGCSDVGGKFEVESAKKVIEWLNGKASGYSAPSGGTEMKADWSTGATGMIGKSWDGTIANGVASTGVEGLKTIVPIAAISSWYDYYRSAGVPTREDPPSGLASHVDNDAANRNCQQVYQEMDSGAPSNGDVTPVWTARNYVETAANVKASVFVVHGINDLNVKSGQFGQYWSALPAGTQRKIWLSQTGHVDPFDFRRKEWVDTLHRWFDKHLLGKSVDTGPGATIERTPDQWVDEPEWAANTVTPTKLHGTPGSQAGLGTLGTAAPAPGAAATVKDNQQQDHEAWAASPDRPAANRALFTTGALTEDVRVSGTTSITVTVTPNIKAARLTAVLVDYGPATTRDYTGDKEGIKDLSTRSSWGEDREGDSASYGDTAADTTQVDRDVISRGWADLGHYKSLSQREDLQPGKAYTMTFNLATTDRVIPKGHQLALIIGGTDAGWISGVPGSPELKFDLARSTVSLPLIGKLDGATAAPLVSTRGLPTPTSPRDLRAVERFR